MKLGIYMECLRDLPFPDALDTAVALGAEAVEIGTGGIKRYGPARFRPYPESRPVAWLGPCMVGIIWA